ncbi:putative ribonuclease H-like domain-containing protein [Tanacetum coccineum]|uniref:Ribonuclease H-like domain-containing protein n=1 Tax=Tanacetum coccineum TaxID=301880 RepID=A0ABQ5GXB5_9ASTR
MTAPSTSSTNDTAKPAYEVSIVSPNVNTASPQVSTASFSENVVYAFMIENPNGSNLLQQDLEQIHEDDLEAMDLKGQLSLLSMRAKRYFQRTCKKIFINANDTAGYDKSKVECFNCHKMGHFARECRASRNKEGFDWSDMAEEQVQTNLLNGVSKTLSSYSFNPPNRSTQLHFLIQSVPSAHVSNSLFMPRRFSSLRFSSFMASTHLPPRSPFQDDNEYCNRNHSAAPTINVVSCLTPPDLEYVANSYDQ